MFYLICLRVCCMRLLRYVVIWACLVRLRYTVIFCWAVSDEMKGQTPSCKESLTSGIEWRERVASYGIRGTILLVLNSINRHYKGRSKYVHQQAVENISVKFDYKRGNYNIARLEMLQRTLIQDTKRDGSKCQIMLSTTT